MIIYYRISLFLLTLTSSGSFLCTCPPPKEISIIQEEEYANSECIYIGQVSKVDTLNGIFDFIVVETFKGEDIAIKYNGWFNTSCDTQVTSIGNWLLYGNFDSNGDFLVNICGLSRSLSNPEDNYNANPLLGNENLSKKDRSSKSQAILNTEMELLRNRM